MRQSLRGGLAAICLTLPTLAAAETAPGLDAICETANFDVVAGPLAFGNIQVYRGPFDFAGPRIAGCVENRGDETIDAFDLVHHNVQKRPGGGGGTGTVSLRPLAPGTRTVFLTTTFSHDQQRLDRYGIMGIVLHAIKIPQGWVRIKKPDGSTQMQMDFREHRLTPRPEMPYPQAPLPEGELGRVCAAIDVVDAGDGIPRVSHLRLSAFPDGKVRVTGCLTNHTEAPLAASHGHRHPARYRHADMSSERWGQLTLAKPLEPGRSGVFVSHFDVPEGVSEVELKPSRE